jgi:hypothetical protein
MALEIFKYNRLKFDQLYEDAKSYLATKYQQAGDVFTSASPYGQLLEVALNMGRLILFYVEDSITELNINTATRDRSIRSLARLAGHNPTRAIAATGTLRLTYNGKETDMYGNTLIIPNYTLLTNGENGLSYLIVLQEQENRLVLEGRNYVDVNVVQGSVEVQQLTATGTPLQSYSLTVKKAYKVDNFFVKVYVNNQLWKIYDSVYDMPYEAEGCVVKTGQDGGIDLFFGNKYFGKTPDPGSTIRVEYLTTAGAAGNISKEDPIDFKFKDNGYDILGNTVDLNEILKVDMKTLISFGSNEEPIEMTKLLAPKTSRSFVLANADSYIYFLEKFNFFSVIDAFTTFDDNDVSDDNVIYLFLIPDVNKRKNAADDYYTIPVELFTLTTEEKNKVYDLIENSGQKILTTVLKILDPVLSKYVMNINVIAYEGYSKDTIRQQIISQSSDYFLKNRRRDRIPKSDLIRIIENVDGVDSVNVWFVSEKNELYKSNPANADKADVGVDSFGDIIITRGELAIIRGGWTDRYGIKYEDSTTQAKPSSVNITFGKDSILNLNLEMHRINVENIVK